MTTAQSLLETVDPDGSILLYPSACSDAADFQQAPFDTIILNSGEFPTAGRTGKVLCLNLDNNLLLGALTQMGIRLSAVVIIRDGCMEGGNYECAVRDGFFGRLLPILRSGAEIAYDHGRIPPDVPAQFTEIEHPPYLEAFIQRSDPISPVRVFRVSPYTEVEADFPLGQVRVRVIRESIWTQLRLADRLVLRARGSALRAVAQYLAGRAPGEVPGNLIDFSPDPFGASIEHLLRKADERGWLRLALAPMGEGSYPQFAAEVRLWRGSCPRQIDFYHLNAGDYPFLRGLAAP